MNDILQMANAINILGYGVIAFAVIIVIFLALMTLVIFQNKSFTNDAIKRNQEYFKLTQENTKELKDVIKELGQSVNKMSVNYEFILNNIISHIQILENKYETVTSQMLETILDEKQLSKRMYFLINKYIILTYVEKTVAAITEHFDRNGLNCDERLKMFKENIARDMEKYKNLAIEEMTCLEFDSLKKEKFIQKIKPVYDNCFKEIKETIIDDFCGCEIETTPHYYNFKQQIKNKLNEMSENFLNILKEILR